MKSFFRSERMSLCRMLLHSEAAYDCLVELGRIGKVQFVHHLDGEFQAAMNYVNEVHRCSELQRLLKLLQSQIDDCGLTTIYYPDVDVYEIPRIGDINIIEEKVQAQSKELMDVLARRDLLLRQKLLCQEKLYVLTRAEEFFMGASNRETVMAWTNSVIMNLIRDETRSIERDSQPRLGFFTGTIPVAKYRVFERVLWRVCYGNFFLRRGEIPEVVLDIKRPTIFGHKYAFLVLFLGEAMREKIRKLCQAFSVTLFDYPESGEERIEHRRQIILEMEETDLVLEQTEQQRRRILQNAALDLFISRTKIHKSLMVYDQMNKMGTIQQLDNQKYLLAECWVPTAYLRDVRRALIRGAYRSSKGGSAFPPFLVELRYKTRLRVPPTYFHVNKFTRGFQNLIDSYGMASYLELNPAPYTIITFPFLFAVMFGDVGHGLIMFLFALWMWRNEEKIANDLRMAQTPNEIFSILFTGRYVILLMGLFSMYTGMIYNDFFSKSLNLFGSHWRVSYDEATIRENKLLQLDPADKNYYMGTPYIFGMDPVWDASGENAITTYNSLKMKLAIILGVLHMVFGLFLSAANFNYFRDAVDLYLVFVPQLVFLCCLFLYLAFLIVYKWCVFGGHYKEPYNSACAPSILITFINMILFKGDDKDIKPNCEEEIYFMQHDLQLLLLILAFVSVPVLLIGKPVQIMKEQTKIKAIKDAERQRKAKRETLQRLRQSLTYNVEYKRAESTHHISPEEGEVDMTEVWVHQGIHCIESVLGSVSHTASYLRLWALSLAHDQLATVLWNMVMAIGLTGRNGYLNSITLYLVFWLWAILTVAILVVMEGLSAFLHTLRLHWVEFQSKFYDGAGEAFLPFYFEPSRRYE